MHTYIISHSSYINSGRRYAYVKPEGGWMSALHQTPHNVCRKPLSLWCGQTDVNMDEKENSVQYCIWNSLYLISSLNLMHCVSIGRYTKFSHTPYMFNSSWNLRTRMEYKTLYNYKCIIHLLSDFRLYLLIHKAASSLTAVSGCSQSGKIGSIT